MFARLGLREGGPAKALTAPCTLNALEAGLQGLAGEVTVLARRAADCRVAVELKAGALRNKTATVRVEFPTSDPSSKEFSDAALWVHFEATVRLMRGGGADSETCTGVFTLTEAADGTFSAKLTIRDPRDTSGKRNL